MEKEQFIDSLWVEDVINYAIKCRNNDKGHTYCQHIYYQGIETKLLSSGYEGFFSRRSRGYEDMALRNIQKVAGRRGVSLI
jgi:hypothetical protein